MYLQSKKNLLHKICGEFDPEEIVMMLNEFTQLTDKEKVNLLYAHGVYIGKHKQETTIVLLYQLEGFYAEIYYRKYRCVIKRISCFATTARLDPYLTEIDVEHFV